MFPKGTKRKCSDGGGGDEEAAAAGVKTASYSLQRQCLLDMSLIKLQLCHMLAEPNLCRSVLIANTVRQIQEEMTRDGSWQIMTEALSASQGLSDRLVASEILCRAPTGREPGEEEPKPLPPVGGRPLEEEEEEQEASDAEETLRAVATEADSAYVSGDVDPRWEARVPPEEASEDGDADDEGCGLEEEEEEEQRSSEGTKTMDQVYGTFEIKSPAPSPDPALEELFSDVDASYYDLDTMLTGMQATPKVGPYDLLENLSSHAPSSTCRTDLNELDHIMEIIVGS